MTALRSTIDSTSDDFTAARDSMLEKLDQIHGELDKALAGGGVLEFAEPSQALDSSQPSVDVASDVDDLQVRTLCQQLGESTRGAGAHLRPLGQLVKSE